MNLNHGRQNLVHNKNIDVQNIDNIGSPLDFSLGFFSAPCDFFEAFWIPPKGLPFNFFNTLQHNGCQKIQKGPPFTFFGTVTLFKNLIFKFFSEIFLKSSNGPPFIFFPILQPTGVSQSSKGPPFYNFEP